MTIKELEEFCHQQDFNGRIGEVVIDGLYIDLDRKLYSGPTVIYCPPKSKYVYITPKLTIEVDTSVYSNKYYRYETFLRSESGYVPDMTVIYKKYSMSDDNAVKNAILKLKEKWKNELNKLKIADIEKDFK